MASRSADPNWKFDLDVDAEKKSNEFKLCSWGKSKYHNPHMRGFWFATASFFWAYLGWFAIPPLLKIIREQIGLCSEHDQWIDKDGVAKTECDCRGGTVCQRAIGWSGVAAVGSTVFVRIMLGTLLERFGPRKVQTFLMTIGAIFVACGGLVQNELGLIIVRIFIGSAGATFVTNQFWTTLLFNRKLVGMANATAGGWGNLGGGVVQIVMPLTFALFNEGFGMSEDASWRVAMLVPAAIFLIVAVTMFFMTLDMPTGAFDVTKLGKSSPHMKDYIDVFQDIRIVIFILQYGACFGVELVMNNRLALHFVDMTWKDDVELDVKTGGYAASGFGLMNLFARSVGGISSDWACKHWGFRGRLWAHFLSLMLEGIGLMIFSFQDKFWVALPVLLLFSLGVQMAEGTTYACVPDLMPKHLGIVNAVVGAGGNIGAVIAEQFFIQYDGDDMLVPYRIMFIFVFIHAMLTPPMYWKNKGGMFCAPSEAAAPKVVEDDRDSDVQV